MPAPGPGTACYQAMPAVWHRRPARAPIRKTAAGGMVGSSAN